MHVICTYHFTLPKRNERTQRDKVICCCQKKDCRIHIAQCQRLGDPRYTKSVLHMCGRAYMPCCVYVCTHYWISNSLLETRQLLVRATRKASSTTIIDNTSDHPFRGRCCATASRHTTTPHHLQSIPPRTIWPPIYNTPFICTYRIVVIQLCTRLDKAVCCCDGVLAIEPSNPVVNRCVETFPLHVWVFAYVLCCVEQHLTNSLLVDTANNGRGATI